MRLSLLAPPATVTASDLDARTLSGVALPYGVQGSTSAGLVQVDAGAVTIAKDLRTVKLFVEHGREKPIGYTASAVDAPDALRMSFRVRSGAPGDEALLEASEGVRDALSVELDDVVIRGGHVTAARLVAVALTAIPAYADARLVASDTPPDPDTDPGPVPGDDEDDEDTDTEKDEQMTTTAPEPTEARASLPTAGALTAARPTTGVAQLAATFAAANQGRVDRETLYAALSDIKWSDTGGGAGAPVQALGELWKGLTYQRKIVPQTTYGTDLDNMTIGGFVWNPTPTVMPYTGNKAAIPTNLAKLVWQTFPASRFAGGHDIDRIHLDFHIAGFWEAYWREMTTDYARKTDKYVADLMVAGGTASTATDVWKAVTNGIVAVSPYAGAGQIKVAIAPDLVAGLAGFTTASVPALFGGLFSSLEDIVNVSTSQVPAGKVLVWAQPAVTVKEAGSVPIRVEAVNIPNGGIDAALFGYIAGFVSQPLAVQVVTVTAAEDDPEDDPETSSSRSTAKK
jgi:hypothetical protein